MSSARTALLVVMALLLPALLLGLGDRPVSKIQEVRIAETSREMLASGDWLVPHYNGELRLQKPPLPYWITAASFRAFGIDEFAVRLPAVVFGLGSVLLLFGWSRRVFSLQAAASAALIFGTGYLGIRYCRSGEADAILLFFIVAACQLGYDMLMCGADHKSRLLFGLLLGLGFMTKGPAALAIPLLTLLATAWLEKRFAALLSCFSLPALALMLGVASCWYAWLLWSLPDAATQFVSHQLDETFISGNHVKPPWWYLAHFFEFFAPWGFLLAPAGWWWAFRQKVQLPSPLRYAWVWLGVVFALLTFTVNKQMQYALLLAPPLAIILGHYLAQAEGGFARANKVLFWIFCLAVVVAGGYVIKRHHPQFSIALIWLALPLAIKRILRSQDTPSTPLLIVAMLASGGYLVGESLTVDPPKAVVGTLTAQVASDAPLYQSAPGDGAVSFYARRAVPPVKDEEIPALLKKHGEIWMVAAKAPTIPLTEAAAMATAGELALYRLRYSGRSE